MHFFRLCAGSPYAKYGDQIPISIKVDATLTALKRKIQILREDYAKNLTKYEPSLRVATHASSVSEDRFTIQTKLSPESKADAIIWGILVLVVHFNGALIGIWPIYRHNSRFLNDRLRTLGVKLWQFEMARIFDLLLILNLTCLFVFVTWQLSMLEFKWCAAIIILLYNFGINGMAMGILLVTMFANPNHIHSTNVAINSIAIIYSGALWPEVTVNFPILSQCLPHSSVVQSIQVMVLQREGFENATFLRGIWIPIVWTVVMYAGHLVLAVRDKLNLKRVK